MLLDWNVAFGYFSVSKKAAEFRCPFSFGLPASSDVTSTSTCTPWTLPPTICATPDHFEKRPASVPVTFAPSAWGSDWATSIGSTWDPISGAFACAGAAAGAGAGADDGAFTTASVFPAETSPAQPASAR